MSDIQKIKARCGYAGKPQQWQYGFDLAIRELQAANTKDVPEGFVLVPRQLSDEEARKHAEAIFKKVEHLARYETRDLSESEFESFKNRWIDARTLTIQFDWKAMIEVQVTP